MGRDIHPGDIRDKPCEPMEFDVQNYRALLFLFFIAVALCSQKQPELKWHIESR